jgi:hypothetical protein
MSNDPSRQEVTEAQSSTNGSNNQATSSQQDDPSNSSHPGQTDIEATQVNGQNGSHTDGSSKVINPETPEEMRQELEALRKELATQLQKKQSIDRQLVCFEHALSLHTIWHMLIKLVTLPPFLIYSHTYTTGLARICDIRFRNVLSLRRPVGWTD